jgi:hypothetical protein
MSKVVLGMSVSADGIAGPDVADADGMALFEEILGGVFPLRSWRAHSATRTGAMSRRSTRPCSW